MSLFTTYKIPSTEFKDYVPPRDFVGYGGESPANCWPEGKKICVSFVLNYEEGAEMSIQNGDKQSEHSLHEYSYWRGPKTGQRDPLVEEMFDYGIRAGLPRVLKLFKSYGWTFTMWACPRAIQLHGDYGKLIASFGHEFSCHGNHWRRNAFFSGPDEEAESVREGYERMAEATGNAKDMMAGWFIGFRSTAHKHIRSRVAKEKGVPLLYCSDSYNGDLPYYIESPLALDGEKDEGMLIIPYSLSTNDHRLLGTGYNGSSCADDWFEMLRSEFEQLLAEGEAGHPKMMTIAMHTRILMKPSRIMALKKFMDYISQRGDDVWVANRADIARHWRKEFPYEEVGPARKLHQGK